MSEWRRADIVIIVVRGELGKPRPAVVVQSDIMDWKSATIVCPFSSDVDHDSSLRPVVEPDGTNGLRVVSQIMVDRISAVPLDRIKSRIGQLDPVDMDRVDEALLLVLGLVRP